MQAAKPGWDLAGCDTAGFIRFQPYLKSASEWVWLCWWLIRLCLLMCMTPIVSVHLVVCEHASCRLVCLCAYSLFECVCWVDVFEWSQCVCVCVWVCECVCVFSKQRNRRKTEKSKIRKWLTLFGLHAITDIKNNVITFLESAQLIVIAQL